MYKVLAVLPKIDETLLKCYFFASCISSTGDDDSALTRMAGLGGMSDDEF